MSQSNGRTVMVQGRTVWTSGDLFKGKVKTEFGTQRPKLNDQGEPMKEYGFGLAVPKAVLSQAGPGQPGEVWGALHEEAYTLYPSRQLPPGFAMKFKDGDGVDHNGAPYSQREGYAGHIVLTCTTTIPIKYFKFENGSNILVNEGIKCGDFVYVQAQIKAHGAMGAGKAGLYVNPMAVQLIGYGKEIVNTPSGDQIFGTTAPPVPEGASSAPVAPQAGPLVPEGAPPQPHYGVVPQSLQPQAPQAMPQPQAAPQATPQPQQAMPQPQQAAPQPQAPQAPQGFPAPAQPAQPQAGGLPPAPFNYGEKMPG